MQMYRFSLVPFLLLLSGVCSSAFSFGNLGDPGFKDLIARNRSIRLYAQQFAQITDRLRADDEARSALRDLERSFFRKFSDKLSELDVGGTNKTVSDELSASAFASLTQDALSTGASGNTEGGLQDSKIVISGAKGKIQLSTGDAKRVLTLAVAETLEATAVGMVISYASLYPNGTHNLEVKVNDFYEASARDHTGHFVDARVRSKRFMFKRPKAAFGVSRIFILDLSDGFLKFTSYTLVAGSALKTQHILSKSIVRIQTYKAASGRCILNDGLFLSENRCGFDGKCDSKHYGWLKVDNEGQQQSKAQARGDAAKQQLQASVSRNSTSNSATAV